MISQSFPTVLELTRLVEAVLLKQQRLNVQVQVSGKVQDADQYIGQFWPEATRLLLLRIFAVFEVHHIKWALSAKLF